MRAIVISRPGHKLSLAKVTTKPPKGLDQEHVARELAPLEDELGELQDLMWGARTHGCLIVLQGRDTAGKDGTIKRVAGALNPRGMHVTSFGVPTPEEREHDFLWRIHKHTPRAGEVAIFNRSHYEDVLVPRVHGLIDKDTCRARYRHIVDFERLLTDHGCIVLKFFLHISKAEQRERLIAREREPEKAWKIDPNDWKERRHFGDYTRAYQAAIRHCSVPQAPWYLVPADSKSYRNLVVAEAVVSALRPHRAQWQRTLAKKGRALRAAVNALPERHSL